MTLVRVNAAAQILAAIALARGRAPRLSSTVLAASLLPTTVAGHQFWNETDPATKANQKVHFFKNLSMLGGLILARSTPRVVPASPGARSTPLPAHAARSASASPSRRSSRLDSPRSRSANSLGGVETRPEGVDLWPAPVARGPVDARIELPGSKSLTNRALVLAALSDGPSVVAVRCARATPS